MQSAQVFRLFLATVIAGGIPGLLTGCGSSGPAPGSQINVTIPPAEARKQNNAYKDYAKQAGKKGQPPK